MKPVIVFGSINMDLVTRTPRLPLAGETLQGYEFFTAAGGKGANQAVAAARLGISTQMVGRVGNDDFGHQLRDGLQAAGVHTDMFCWTRAQVLGLRLLPWMMWEKTTSLLLLVLMGG
jgi:ribokinase